MTVEAASPKATWAGPSASSDSAPSGRPAVSASTRCASIRRRVRDTGSPGSLAGRGLLLLPARCGSPLLPARFRGPLFLPGLVLVGLAPVVRDVEAGAFEQQPSASRGHAAGRP